MPFSLHHCFFFGFQMDPNKVSTVLNWHAPKSVKQVQRFLGFANCYRSLIRGCSALTAPITALTKKPSAGPFRWNSRAEASFVELKRRFSLEPILVTPNPSLPYTMEVDASELGVGAILSQHSPIDHKLHLCAYFLSRPRETTTWGIGNCWASN